MPALGELVPGGSPYSQARTRLSEENLSLTGNRSRVGNSWIPRETKWFVCVASLRAVVPELSSCWSPGLFVAGLSSSFFLQSFRWGSARPHFQAMGFHFVSRGDYSRRNPVAEPTPRGANSWPSKFSVPFYPLCPIRPSPPLLLLSGI